MEIRNFYQIKMSLKKIDLTIGKFGILSLLALALVYYGIYYRTGLSLGGEGGTNAVLAMRLMEGQRPIVDTFLGYNLMWFYPLVALFNLTGPDYVAMRIFFFAICALTAVLGFTIVHQATRQGWLALLVGVLLVLVPGMLFRNYMGFIGVISMLFLIKGFVLDSGSRLRQIAWMGAAGGGLGLCYLIRIEPSLLLSIVWVGLIVLYPLGRKDWLREVLVALAGGFLGVALLLAVHAPFYWHAKHAGFGDAFTRQYVSFWNLLQYELSAEITKFQQPVPAQSNAKQEESESAAPVSSGGVEAQNPSDAASRDGRLERPQFREIFGNGTPRDRSFAAMIYYPVVVCAIFVPFGLLLVIIGISRANLATKEDGLLSLVSIGCSLSLFPQYFFFRPDPPHLSEFMVPFIAALALSAFAFIRSGWRIGSFPMKYSAIFAGCIAAFGVPLYLKAIMPRESAGTIFKTGKLVEFKSLNGVQVKLPKQDALVMEGLRDAILKNSKDDEFVVCYPYSPTINFMTNRRSYEHNLYVDNATAGADFQKGAIERLEKFHPAVVVIDNRPINKSESSRFLNWAGDFMQHLEQKYRLESTYVIGSKTNFVYVRNID
jgi:hypothetical protein